MHPSIVSKEDLLSSGWPSRVVGPNSLNMAIKSIRKNIGELGVSEVIITVPREGFKLSDNINFILSSNNGNSGGGEGGELLAVSDSEMETFFTRMGNASLIVLCSLLLVIFKLFLIFHSPYVTCKDFGGGVKVCAIEKIFFLRFDSKRRLADTYVLGRSYEAVYAIKEIKVK